MEHELDNNEQNLLSDSCEVESEIVDPPVCSVAPVNSFKEMIADIIDQSKDEVGNEFRGFFATLRNMAKKWLSRR